MERRVGKERPVITESQIVNNAIHAREPMKDLGLNKIEQNKGVGPASLALEMERFYAQNPIRW